jgi:hypothetical protein
LGRVWAVPRLNDDVDDDDDDDNNNGDDDNNNYNNCPIYFLCVTPSLFIYILQKD